MSSKMIYSKCFKVGDRYAFSTHVGDDVVFTSNEPNIFFFGSYGTYGSPAEAKRASSDMLFRNSPVLVRLSQSSRSSIKSLLIDKYMKTVEFLNGIYQDIIDDYSDDSYNNLDRTVPILDSILEDTAGEGKQLDLVVNQMEESVSGDYEPPENGTVNESEISSDEAKQILKMRDWMRYLMSTLEKNFPQFLKAVSKNSMIKEASSSFDIGDLINEVAMNYCDRACRSCGMGTPRIESAKDLCGDLGLMCRGNDGRRVMVVVGTDLSYRGMMPLSGGPSHGSMAHFTEMLLPSMNAVGHMRPIGHDFLMVPSQKNASGPDCFDGFDAGSMEPIVIRVKQVGGKRTKNASCSYCRERISSASSEQSIKNANDISNASLVEIVIPNSKYEGMAGTVDPSKILFRNDHIEFPVSLEYDTGEKIELWVTDEDVKIYK